MGTIASLIAEFGAKDTGFEKMASAVDAKVAHVQKAMDNMRKTETGLYKDVGSLKTVALGTVAALAGLATAGAYSLLKLASAGAETDANIDALESSLARMNGSGNARALAVDFSEFATQIQRSSRFTDDAAISAAALGISLGIPISKIKGATTAAVDFATRTHTSLEAALEGMAKASHGQAMILQRQGIEIDQAALKARGLDYVLQVMSSHFNGAGADSIQNYEGRLIVLGHAWDDVLKTTGQVLSQSPLLNAWVEEISKAFYTLTDYISKNHDAMGEVAVQGIHTLAAAMRIGIQVLGLFARAWSNVTTAANLAIYSITEIAGKIVGTAAQIVGTIAEIMGTIYEISSFMPSGSIIGNIIDKTFGTHVQSDQKESIENVATFAKTLGDAAIALAGDDGMSTVFMRSALEAANAGDAITKMTDDAITGFDRMAAGAEKAAKTIAQLKPKGGDAPRMTDYGKVGTDGYTGYANKNVGPYAGGVSGLNTNAGPQKNFLASGTGGAWNIDAFMARVEASQALSGIPMATNFEHAVNVAVTQFDALWKSLPEYMRGGLTILKGGITGLAGTMMNNIKEGFASGGIWGAVAAAFATLLVASKTFATLLEMVNGILQQFADFVGQLLAPWVPILKQTIELFRPFLAMLSILVRVLQMLDPVFIVLAVELKALTWVAKMLFTAIKDVALGILKVVKWMADRLGIHISGLNSAIKDLTALTWDNANATGKMANAANAAADALTNVPTGYKYALEKWRAMTGGPQSGADDGYSGGGTGYGGGIGTVSNTTPTAQTQSHQTGGSAPQITVVIQAGALSGVKNAKEFFEEIQRMAGRVSTVKSGTFIPMKGF